MWKANFAIIFIIRRGKKIGFSEWSSMVCDVRTFWLEEKSLPLGVCVSSCLTNILTCVLSHGIL